jgi:hypothetical protein
MIIVVAWPTSPWTDMALAGDRNSFHHGQVHDQDGGCGDAHVGNVEDRPVWQLEEVDHVAPEHTWGTEQPVSQVPCNTSTQQPNGNRPGGMADPRYQFDDHEAEDCYGRDREYVGEALSLAESSAGVANQAQSEQSTQ